MINNTMFVARTKDFPHDAWDDVSKLPFQTTYNSLRYINADKAFHNMTHYIQTVKLHQS